MMKKKKQSRSQSSTKKSQVSSPDSSPSPKLLSVIRSKLASGKDLKNMFRGMRSKTIPGLSSQSRIVRCPNCHKLLQEPLDATSYKCGGCDSIIHAKRLELEDNVITIPKALLSSQNNSLDTQVESGYKSRASSSSSHSKTVYKHEKTSDVHRDWIRRADEFSTTGDSDLYNSHRNVSKWTEQEERYEDLPRVPFYPESPSPSSTYEYGYNSPYQGSQDYHHHPNQIKQGWFQEFSDGKYNHWSSQSQLHDLQYLNLYESSSSATRDRSVYSERSYQAAAAPYRYTYSEKSLGISKSETSSDKSSSRDKKYVRERKPKVKRHVLPSAGGAPFVTCSYCLELLQLPQVSSLHGKHNRYQVRCGSCSGVLKFSIGEKVDNVLDSLRLVDSGTGFADETVTIDQDSASESHLSCSDNDFGDTICRSNDHVVLSRSLETCEDKGTIASSETIGESSRIHLEQSKEADSEMLHEMAKEISLEAETVAEKLISYSTEPLNKNEYVCEIQELSEHTRDTQELDWKETEKTEEEIIGDKSGLDLEKSQYIKDLIYDSSSSNSETFEDRTVKEETGHMSNTFDVAISGEATAIISRINGKQSQDIKLEEFQYDYENLSQSQELDKAISDIVRYELEESLNETTETLELDMFGEDGSVVSPEKASEKAEETVESSYGTLEQVYLQGRGYAGERTWLETEEARAGLHLEEYESNYENYCKPLEWTSETAPPTFHMHEYELGTILEPEEDADDNISESSSRGSFSDHESSEENDVSHESQDAKTDQAESPEYDENSSERQELSNTVFDIVRSESHENIYKTNETLEPGKTNETIIDETSEERSITVEGSGSASERIWEETMGDGSGLELEESQSNPFEWTSQRAPTFSLHEYEQETMPESDEDANREPISYELHHLEKCENESTISEETFVWTSERVPTILESDEDVESSSSDSSNNNESSEVRSVFHEDLQLVNDNRTEMVEDELEKLDETFEWTAGRALTFRLHENELDTMLKEDADGLSESSSRSSFNEHESSNKRKMNHEEELLLVDEHALNLKEGESETKELKEALEPKDAAIFSLSPYNTLEQENMMFHLEMSQGKAKEVKKLEFGSRVSSEGHETSSKTAEEDSEAEEVETLENKSRLTSEQYPPFYNTTEPFEIVETMKLDKALEPSTDAIFSLNPQNTLEQEENMMFHLEMSQEKQSLELGKAQEEKKLESSSSVSSEGHETSSKTAEEDSESEEETLRDDLEHSEKENDKSRLTSEQYPPFYNTTEPFEIVETMKLDKALEPSDAMFRLNLHNTLEQENMMSQEKQSLEQGKAQEEKKLESSSRVSSEGHEDSEAEEETMGDDLKNKSSRLNSEPYPHLYCPPEVVGLRHALYETQTSPLTSPIHTPIGSPLHYLMMSSQFIPSSMHSHIVSPLRSPINSSGSLSDVLFFKLDDDSKNR